MKQRIFDLITRIPGARVNMAYNVYFVDLLKTTIHRLLKLNDLQRLEA